MAKKNYERSVTVYIASNPVDLAIAEMKLRGSGISYCVTSKYIVDLFPGMNCFGPAEIFVRKSDAKTVRGILNSDLTLMVDEIQKGGRDGFARNPRQHRAYGKKLMMVNSQKRF